MPVKGWLFGPIFFTAKYVKVLFAAKMATGRRFLKRRIPLAPGPEISGAPYRPIRSLKFLAPSGAPNAAICRRSPRSRPTSAPACWCSKVIAAAVAQMLPGLLKINKKLAADKRRQTQTFSPADLAGLKLPSLRD